VRFGLSASSRFQPYQIRFRLRPPVGAGSTVRHSLFGLSDFSRSGLRRFRSNFGSDFPSEGVVRAFRRGNYFTGFPVRLIIGPTESNFGNAKKDPLGKLA
ncbi:hypothetical protein ACWC2K_38390, partial [Streptomyces chattanoogensis]